MFKYCPSCKEEKHTIKFQKNKTRKDGLQAYCKKCQKIKAALYYQKNKEYFKHVNKKRSGDDK